MIVCRIMATVVTCALPSQMDLGVAVLLITPWIPTAGIVVVSLFYLLLFSSVLVAPRCKRKGVPNVFQKFCL